MKKILLLPLLIPKEVFIFILKHFYGCQIKEPHGKNRVGNKLYRQR
jgi:hypothetical protein